MTYLEKLQNYLRVYEGADKFFKFIPTEGDFAFSIHCPYPAPSPCLRVFDFRTIVLASVRTLARDYLESEYYKIHSDRREYVSQRYLNAMEHIKKATLDTIIERLNTLDLPFKGEKKRLISRVQPNLSAELNAKATWGYLRWLKKQFQGSADRYLTIDLLRGILHLQDASLIKRLLNLVTEDQVILYFLEQARELFSVSSAPEKQALIQSIDEYRHIAFGTMLFLHRMVNNIGEMYGKNPKVISSRYVRKAFPVGKFFDVQPMVMLPSSLNKILTEYLKVYQVADFKISPLNLAKELQIPDSIAISGLDRRIEMRDPIECVLVQARQITRRYLKQSQELMLPDPDPSIDLIFSAFFVIFSCLKCDGITSSKDLIAALSTFPERERTAFCECLIAMVKHLLDVAASLDARFSPAQGNPFTIRLESGEVRIPNLITVVMYRIRQLMCQRMQSLDPRTDSLVALEYLFCCVKLIMTIAKRGLLAIQEDDGALLEALPEEERRQLSEYVATERIDQFQACNRTICSQGDFFVFSEHVTVLRLRLEKLEKLIVALTEERPLIKDREVEIKAISNLDPEQRQEALKYLQDEFNAGEITPNIESRLRALLQRLERQRQHLVAEIDAIQKMNRNTVQHRADRDLASTLECFAGIDEYVLSTAAPENVDLSQPVKLAFQGINFSPLVAFRTMLLVVMRKAIRQHVGKDLAVDQAFTELLSNVTAASFDQLLDVISGLTSEIAEVKDLIGHIQKQFNEDVVFKCYVQHQALIDACDVRGLHECMRQIRSELAAGDVRNEPLLTAFEMMVADVQASQRLCERVYAEVIARDAEMFEDWLWAEEQKFETCLSEEKKQFDQDKLIPPQLYVKTCERFDSMIECLREPIGLLRIKYGDNSLQVWDLQTWAAMIDRQDSVAAGVPPAAKADALSLLAVPGYLNEKNFTTQQMWLACGNCKSLNSEDVRDHIEKLIEDTRREYKYSAQLCYQRVKQKSDDKELFNDIVLNCQQLYQQKKFLIRLKNNMILTERLSESLEKEVDPVGFQEKQNQKVVRFKREKDALEILTKLYHETLNTSVRVLARRELTDHHKLVAYFSRYEVFDDRYDRDKISLGKEKIIPDPYTRVMIEIRKILREHFGDLESDEITAFSKFLDLNEPNHLKSGSTVHERVEAVLKFLKSYPKYFSDAWVTECAQGYAATVEALLHAMPEEIDKIMVPAIDEAALRCQPMTRELSQVSWVNIDFSQDFQHAGPGLRESIVLLQARVRELETHRQAFMSEGKSNTLVKIRGLLIEILPRILDIQSLYEAQLLADPESLSFLLQNIKVLQKDQQRRDEARQRLAVEQQRDSEESEGAAAAESLQAVSASSALSYAEGRLNRYLFVSAWGPTFAEWALDDNHQQQLRAVRRVDRGEILGANPMQDEDEMDLWNTERRPKAEAAAEAASAAAEEDIEAEDEAAAHLPADAVPTAEDSGEEDDFENFFTSQHPQVKSPLNKKQRLGF